MSPYGETQGYTKTAQARVEAPAGPVRVKLLSRRR